MKNDELFEALGDIDPVSVKEAKKYRTRTEFHKANNNAYIIALKNGWIDEYDWFKPLPRAWTYVICKKEARKYQSRTQFKNALPSAYAKSRINGWLDDFFPEKSNE